MRIRRWSVTLMLLMLCAALFLPVCASAYQAPEMLTAEFHESQALNGGRAKIDISSVNQGYVGVSGQSDTRLKFQVLKDEDVYTYDMPSNGSPCIFPLQSGDGSYHFRIMENIVDKKYSELFSADAEVTITDPFQPFLRPSTYVNYSASSACVAKAGELAAGASDALGTVSAIYDYICSTVTYDREKAATVKSGYLPYPDETMTTGKGICFDYASLAAAMLRSQGIPTKLIFGYVAPKELYHAWNMFYTEQTGWVTVSFEVSADSWNRMDLTFAANGADASFIGDGSNYSDVYFY